VLPLRVSFSGSGNEALTLPTDFKGQLFATTQNPFCVRTTSRPQNRHSPPLPASKSLPHHRQDDSPSVAHPSNPSYKQSQNTMHRPTILQRPCTSLQTPDSLRIDETNVIASETGQETSKGRLGTVYVGLLWSLCIRRCSQCNEYGLYVPHSASTDRCSFLGSKIGP